MQWLGTLLGSASSDPLDSLDVLEQPVGVMTAGRWMTMQQLTEIIEAQKKTYQSLYP